jgi:membrane carboxypeptidase/penicillin-binding protein
VKLTGAAAALPIFADVLEVARGKAPAQEWELPTGVEAVDVNTESGQRAGFLCGGETEYFLLGTAPTESCGLFAERAPQAETGESAREASRPRHENPIQNAFERIFGWLGRGR